MWVLRIGGQIMKDRNSIFILIRFTDGTYSDWIEIEASYFNIIKSILMDKSRDEFIAIFNRNDTYPLLVRISEIQSVEADVPTDEEFKEVK